MQRTPVFFGFVLMLGILQSPLTAVTVRASQLSASPSSGTCSPPSAVTSFPTSATEVWAYFLVDQALTGDVPKFEWLNPSGQVQRTISYAALPSGGSFCFDPWLTKASDPLILTPGTWSVRLVWNGSSTLATLTFAVTGAGGGSSAATVVGSPVMTKIASPACTSNPPAAANTFSTTDSNITIWFTLAGLRNGDSVSVTANGPNGASLVPANFPNVSVAAGTTSNWFCSSWTPTATTAAGTWTIRVYQNNSSNPIFSQIFTLTSAGGGGGGGGGLTGTWQITANTCFLNPPTWQATMSLVEAVDGTLSGTMISDPQLKSKILPNGVGFANDSPTPPRSFHSGSNFGLVVYPDTWESVLYITGTVSGNQITGRIIHYSSDNCSTFTLTQTGGGAGGGGGGGGAPAALNVNLVQNGNAEASSPPNSNCTGAGTIPGWTITGDPSPCAYGPAFGGPLLTSPGPPDRGQNFFAGGNVTRSTMSQTIDVSAFASQIDSAAGIICTFSAYLGGYQNQNDNAKITATLRGFGSPSILGPVFAAERNNITGLISKSTAGPLPAGTRFIDIVVEFTRTDGTGNDGYADNISLILSSGTGGGGGGGDSFILRTSPNPLDFGQAPLNLPKTLNVTLSTPGNSFQVRPTASAPFSVSPSLVTVPAGGSVQLPVTFTPTSISAQPITGQLVLTGVTASGALPTWSVGLTGSGVTGGGGGGGASGTCAINVTSDKGLGPFNLTTEGTADWYHIGIFAQPSASNCPTGSIQGTQTCVAAQRKNGPKVLGDLQFFGLSNNPGPFVHYVSDQRGLSWTDGTQPLPSGSQAGAIMIDYGGFQFTAPADQSQRTLTLHVGVAGRDPAHTGKLIAHIDGLTDQVIPVGDSTSQDLNYKIVYQAPQSTQMTVTFKQDQPTDWLSFQAAALSLPVQGSSCSATGGGGTGGGGTSVGGFTNGGFELPGTGDSLNVPKNSTFITGWVVTKDNVDYISSYFQPSEGRYSIDLDGNTPGAIAQTFATAAGTNYTVTFDMAGNTGGGSGVKSMRVSAAGSSQDFTFDTTGKSPSNMGWTTKTFVFTATVASTTLEFASLGSAGSNAGPALDNVRVTTGGTPGGGGGGGGTPGCDYNVSPTDVPASGNGASNIILVFTGPTCTWTATQNPAFPWITVGSSGVTRTGGGSAGWSVPLNPSASPRTGTFTVAGKTVTLTQAAGTPCTFTLNPPANQTPIPSSGGTTTFLVNPSNSSCAWTVTLPALSPPWVTVASGLGGTGNGSVTLSATLMNPSGPRSANITVGNQGGSATFTINQAGSSPCTFRVSPTANATPIPASGGNTYFDITPSDGSCPWYVADLHDWISFPGGKSGVGVARVNLTIAENKGSARIGDMFIAAMPGDAISTKYTVNQEAANLNNAPVIAKAGVVNAASYLPASIPAGAIAQGSFFSIFGSNLGPAATARVTSFPLGTTLGGVSLKFTAQGRTVDAIPAFVAPSQINGIMPSNAPTGDGTMTVTYNGLTSPPMAVKVVVNNFGSFSTAGGQGPGIIQNFITPDDQPLNTTESPAKPGQAVILWGTGLGPVAVPDNQAPPAADLPFNVQIFVGGKLATKLYSGRTPCCSGVDQLVFYVPNDTPQGCYVPVQVQVGGTFSNQVTMAIDASGQKCSNTSPSGGLPVSGGKSGSVLLGRADVIDSVLSGSSGSPSAFSVDWVSVSFTETSAGGATGFNPFQSLPPLGSCSTNNGKDLDLLGLLGGSTASLPGGGTKKYLDAGTPLSITGPSGTKSIPKSDSGSGSYMAFVGGALPLGLSPSQPAYFASGLYTVSGNGGKDVGAFQARVNATAAPVWTNRDQITQIDRSFPINITWSGGDPASQYALIMGLSNDSDSKNSGSFVCLAPMGDGRFTIPVSAVANLPATGASTTAFGTLIFGAAPSGTPATFTANGIESGFGRFMPLSVKTMQVK